MSDTPTGGVTVDTSEFEPQGQTPGVLPAQEPDQGAEAASPVDDGRPTDNEPTVETLQEQLSRKEAELEKARQYGREQERLRMVSEHENKQRLERERADVRAELAEFKNRLDQGESLTREELNRQNELIRAEMRLEFQQRDAANRQAQSEDYGSKLKTLATGKQDEGGLGMSDAEYNEFLMEYSVLRIDPRDGQAKWYAFGEIDDPKRAYEFAEALLEKRTRPQYENRVRQTEMQKADELRKKQIRSALPGGAPPKQQPPPDPQESYKAAIRQAGQNSNPNDWW